MATTNKVKGWTGVLMTEDSSSHWPTKRRHVYYETSGRAGLEFVCVFGHDAIAACWSRWIQPAIATSNSVKGWIGVLMTGDSSFHWRTKPRRL